MGRGAGAGGPVVSTPVPGQRTLAVLLAVTALTAACGAAETDDGAGDGTEPPAADATMPGGRGPRVIPATIVDLEPDAFPRPAAEACEDNTDLIEVAAGESIAAALAEAEPDTTVSVAAGTYMERPDEWLALDVGTDDVCLRATDGEAVLQAADDQTLGISLTGDDVVIEGFVLRGFEIGIGIDGREDETQQQLTIEDTRIEAPSGEFREGIVAFGEPSDPSTAVLDGLLLLDVVVDGTDLGVSCNVGPCEHVWLERTRIAGRTGPEDSGADAFAIEEGRQIAVVDTVVQGAAADGIDTKADDVVVFGTQVLDVGRNGVKLWRGGDVINSVIDGTGGDASLVGEEPGTYRYLHTLVAHHGDPGDTPYVGTWSYDVGSSDLTVEIVNSIFYENSPGGFFVPRGATLSVRHSIFDGGSDHRLFDMGGDEGYTFADLAAFQQAGFGEANQVADPGFVDAAARDFSTGAASPARDAGEVVEGLDVDATGEPRVRGVAPDVGPIES
jgi:hypothetical protein